jgi:hypothetical protein
VNCTTEIRELNTAELDLVSGGMDRKTAIAVSKAYIAAGDVMLAIGYTSQASVFYGKALDVL